MLRFLVKSTISSTIIVGGGYLLMQSVMPNEQDLRRTIEEKRPVPKVDKEVYHAQMRAIMENAKSDRPIWDVKFPTKQDVAIMKKGSD